ncbi:hypothetical protein TELCIR_17331 [Teladorsagia circumcincta]|uniref:Uncharacterized protein n=1 Tax=Teladorsagia circumcincta TaxID=45464 RepID=A0A2G9TT42_TELCI|nr:hypothetical protein TELCIR_17331 [Teladorsagia circumcincta]
MPSSPPAAHSSPREEHRVPPTSPSAQHPVASYSASLPSPLNRPSYPNSNYQQLPGKTFPTVRYLPKGPTSPSSLPNGNAAYGKPPMYNNPPIVRPQQEPVVVRPIELAMPKDEMNLRHREEHPRSTTTFGVMAPTAFTQSHDAVNEELDRLDAKGINMTEEETRRYR